MLIKHPFVLEHSSKEMQYLPILTLLQTLIHFLSILNLMKMLYQIRLQCLKEQDRKYVLFGVH
jgi:hypothetical protein